MEIIRDPNACIHHIGIAPSPVSSQAFLIFSQVTDKNLEEDGGL